MSAGYGKPEIEETRAAAVKKTATRVVEVTLPVPQRSKCGWQKSIAKR
jgi:hypothetical protein